MKRLWFRIASAFFILILVLIFILGFFLAALLKNAYTDMTRNHLVENAEMVTQLIVASESYGEREQLQELIQNFEQPIQMRFTVVDTEGVVLADSENDPAEMNNHFNRPEIQDVLEQDEAFGESIRYSTTQDFNMMYVALPLVSEGETVGAVRTSLSLGVIDDAMNRLWFSLSIALGLMFLIAAIASTMLARSITRPIDSIMNVTSRLRKNDYSSRVNTEAKGEIGDLSQSINALAASLQRQMKEIEENEQQLTSIISNMVSGVMLVNQDGKVELLNSAMERFLSQHKGNLIGQPYEKVGERFALSPHIHAVFETNEKVHEEVHSYYPQERIMDAHLAPYYGQGWQQRGVIVVLHDITEIRRLEKMRSDFVANVSHELKTPVTSVRGFSETLMSGEVTDEETTKQFLKIIHDESQRLDRLIRDLLNLSKIERQKMPLNLETLNMTALVHEVSVTLQGAIEEKQTRLVLPDPSKDVYLQGDEDRLRQIILNLVGNGINYTAEGGTVTVSLKENVEKVRLIIKDDGIGIPEESLPRIFERFYRVDRARSRHSGGTGLGLAIVKHLIESHHGEIEVESREGEGTTFTVILPKKQEEK
ncbi:two-component system histidine kinase PnpS [Salinicoccus roseus]|uniref:two-component system histidine kinase PnpS n=1 Tax=Salinicoccus roseus TaxID=45670 RepID=UPI000F4E7152|nr:ATP-binding protein [Salinicoccus roseus]RPE55098.1 histidine kinase [Salinicoccus roseus]GGA60118.1 PAS domain-containing sensor histidine kinase [Salinicoccus roseus]